MRIRYTVPFFFILLASCSSMPPLSERYVYLDYDQKTVFLTYYPYLSPDQRDQFLSSADQDPRKLIEDWQGQLNDPDHRVGTFDEMMGNANNRKITSLEIRLDQPEPIVAGNHVRASAFATYANGIKVEITPDTEWRVEPHIVNLDHNRIGFDCVNSDITLTASFLGEKQASKVIAIRKPLQSLEIRTSDSYIGVDEGYNFQLQLLAHCKDGSTSDVSCQADWKSVATGGKIEGCGNFIVTSKEKLAEDALTVKATYGNLSARRTLTSPLR